MGKLMTVLAKAFNTPAIRAGLTKRGAAIVARMGPQLTRLGKATLKLGTNEKLVKALLAAWFALDLYNLYDQTQGDSKNPPDPTLVPAPGAERLETILAFWGSNPDESVAQQALMLMVPSHRYGQVAEAVGAGQVDAPGIVAAWRKLRAREVKSVNGAYSTADELLVTAIVDANDDDAQMAASEDDDPRTTGVQSDNRRDRTEDALKLARRVRRAMALLQISDVDDLVLVREVLELNKHDLDAIAPLLALV